MSGFLRPGAKETLRRHGWLIGGAVLAALALGGLAEAALAGAPLALGGLAVLLCAAVWMARDGLLRARLSGDAPGPGLVAVREGRVAYFGPDGGGVADLDALGSIALARGPHGPVWLMRGADGTLLRAPTAAEGADALLDAFAALPGFDRTRVARALAAADVEREVWRRPADNLVRLARD